MTAAEAADAKRREERIKLFATAVSNVGVAVVVTGFVAPLLGGRAGTLSVLVAFVSGLGLHLLAQAVLELVVVSPGGADEQLE